MKELDKVMFGGLFTGWGAGTVPLILMWAPNTHWWSGAAWGGLFIFVLGIGVLLWNLRNGEVRCNSGGGA